MTSFDPLEPRTLFASAFPNINVSRTSGNHAEGTIVVDPTDPSRLFTASNAPGTGLLVAISDDAGTTWSRRTVAGEAAPGSDLSPDGFAPACCDPSAAVDLFGNLYLAYARDADHGVELLRSRDGGATFTSVASFRGDLDQPTVTTGPDSVWVTFKRGSAVAAAGAPVNSAATKLDFGAPVNLPGSRGGNFGDVAVGPDGQVAVTYQQGLRVCVNLDPDGLGPAGFRKKVVATKTHVSGFDRIAAQAPRGIDAEADLVFESFASGRSDRLYLVYTDEQPDGSDNTDVVLRYSDDSGATWGDPMRVNSDDGLSSQFLPRVAIDGSTNDLYFAWYDTRNDAGAGSPADTNGQPNDDAELFVCRARPSLRDVSFGADVQVSEGSSNAASADSSVDLGDYIGLDVGPAGVVYPLWADNSNTTGDNPDEAHDTLDQYTAAVQGDLLPQPARAALSTLSPEFRAQFMPGRGTMLGGKPDYRFRVSYWAPNQIDPATVDDDDILVTGPGGFAAPATLLSVRPNRRTGGLVATYRVGAAGGRWSRDHNGTYSVAVRQGQVDTVGNLGAVPGGMIGWFVVKTGLPPR